MTAPRFRSEAITHPGTKRRLNEDACLDRPEMGLWAVADGVGGAQAGEVASAAICESLAGIAPGLAGERMLAEIRQRLQNVHAALRASASASGQGKVIASTAVVLIVAGDYFACLWAGDSRAYLLRDGVLRRLTRDHSLVQDMVDNGSLTEAESEGHPRANVITRAVGAGEAELILDKSTGEVRPGDKFMLCTDGLTKTLSEPELMDLLLQPALPSPAERLIEAALSQQARDNVTALTIEVIRS